MEQEEVVLRSPARISRIVPSPEDLEFAAGSRSSHRAVSSPTDICRRRSRTFRRERSSHQAGGGDEHTCGQSEGDDRRRAVCAYGVRVHTESFGLAWQRNHTGQSSSVLRLLFSPRGEMQEMNQLYEVMQSADVVIAANRYVSYAPGCAGQSYSWRLNRPRWYQYQASTTVRGAHT